MSSQSLPELAEAVAAGDRGALARAITVVENDGPAGWELVRGIYDRTAGVPVVGLTGPPGAGKSTLIDGLVRFERERDRTVAVLTIDPSSPFSGGAVLGDRVRLGDHFTDPGVFIRSMANRGAGGGMAEAALQAALLMTASGRDVVLLESVGVGQTEVDISDHADTVVLVLTPGSGDSIQAMKAGVMEIPDVIVVNRADHPHADEMVRDIRTSLSLGGPRDGWRVPIVKTQATTHAGVPELVAEVERHRAHLAEHGAPRTRGRDPRAQALALARLRAGRDLGRCAAADAEIARILDDTAARRVDPGTAADAILERWLRVAAGA